MVTVAQSSPYFRVVVDIGMPCLIHVTFYGSHYLGSIYQMKKLALDRSGTCGRVTASNTDGLRQNLDLQSLTSVYPSQLTRNGDAVSFG